MDAEDDEDYSLCPCGSLFQKGSGSDGLCIACSSRTGADADDDVSMPENPAISESPNETEEPNYLIVCEEVEEEPPRISPPSSPTPVASSSLAEKEVKEDQEIATETHTQSSIEDFQSSKKQTDPKGKKRRCLVCKRKLGLTGFECRCGGLYCSQHRYFNEHDCTFDYREHGAQEISKNNPLVIGEKIRKI